MSPDEAAAVLAYAAAADPRFNTVDAEQAKARVQVWADLLAGVDAQFGLDHVRRYYARHHDWPITPGAVRDSWEAYQRAQEAKARTAALLEARALPAAPHEPSPAQLAAREAMLAAQGTGPKPLPHTIKVPRPVPDAIFEGGQG